MKVEHKIVELDHEDLVNLLSTATYGDNSFDIFVPEEFRELKKCGDDDTWEGRLANVLLNGGKIDIVDKVDDELYEEDVESFHSDNPKFHHLEEYKDSWEDQNLYFPCYRIGYEDILNACASEQGYPYAKELLEDEEGDFYTAWNLLQIILFGEVVYG